MPDEVELSPLEWLRLALMDLEESRRVVACRPEFEAGVRALVAELCIGGVVEVRPVPYLPDGTAALILDPNVIEAITRQAVQRLDHERLARMAEEDGRRGRIMRDERWAVSLSYPPDPRSSVIIAGIW